MKENYKPKKINPTENIWRIFILPGSVGWLSQEPMLFQHPGILFWGNYGKQSKF